MKGKKIKKTTKKPKAKILKVKKPKSLPRSEDSTLKSKVMTCIVTGIERRVSKAGILKGIKKFGDLPSFINHYVSNEAKRLLRQRISPEEVQKQLRPDELKPFSIDHQALARQKLLKKARHKKMTIEEVQQISLKWIPKEPKSYSSQDEYIINNTKNGSCIAPHVYLDSDKVCDHCKYSKSCLSTAKQFSKRYKA